MSGNTDPDRATCWTMIHGAADGDAADRDRFARCYAPVVRAYLKTRWKSTLHIRVLDDAVQEVFVDCFKGGGALERADADRPGGFRAFLFGVVRNVALRVEDRARRNREHPPPTEFRHEEHAAYEARLSLAFDRAWTESLVREAVVLQRERAHDTGETAQRRVELLHLRFYEGLPIHQIAAQWADDPAFLHREYARAREDFHAALLEVVGFHHPGSPEVVRGECLNLLSLLE